MYYEESPAKKRARKRTGCIGRLFRLFLVALILYALVMLFSGQMINFGLFSGTPKELAVNFSLPRGYTNVLLLGCDGLNERSQRADSILIASISSIGELKLTSIMRDTMLDMGAHGAHKLNAAYNIGGAELTMQTINRAFEMNITKYAAIDFSGFAQVIDSMGGIELNITKAEMDQINDGLKKAYKKKRVFNGVLMKPLAEPGKNVHMSGTHALFYARIRNIDTDYKRAERQRIVIDTIVKKLRKTRNPLMLANAAKSILECTDTNMNMVDIGALAVRLLTSEGEIQQFRIPAEGAYKTTMDGGIWAIIPDTERTCKQLREFIYAS